MTVTALLFDLDGTFADTAPDLANALNQLLQAEGRPPLPFERIRPYVSQGSPGMLKVGFQLTSNDTEFARLKEEFLAIYQRQLCIQTRLFDGIQTTLEWLEHKQMIWGIVTNKPDYLTQPLIRQLKLPQAPAVVISGDTCKEKKPHPMPLLEACKRLAIAPEQCIYVGDDRRDIQAAKAALMKSISAEWGYIAPNQDPAQWQADQRLTHASQLVAAVTAFCEKD